MGVVVAPRSGDVVAIQIEDGSIGHDCVSGFFGTGTGWWIDDVTVTEGFDFVQLGRPLIKDPNFVNNGKKRDGAWSGWGSMARS